MLLSQATSDQVRSVRCAELGAFDKLPAKAYLNFMDGNGSVGLAAQSIPACEQFVNYLLSQSPKANVLMSCQTPAAQ